jgi:hypothetical protein
MLAPSSLLSIKLSVEASWVHIFNPGLEKVKLETSALGVMADGEVEERIGDVPYRMHYSVICDPDWNVKELTVERHGPRTRSLDVITDGLGKWYTPACEELPAFEGCTDVNLSAAAFTNTLPIRRLNLGENQKVELKVLYVDASTMEMNATQQRYTCIHRGESESTYYYENLLTGFRVEMKVDAEGLVLDYPGVFRRTAVKS